MNRSTAAIVLLLGSAVFPALRPEARAQGDEATPAPPAVIRSPAALSRPYTARAMQGATTAELFEWMGPGRKADDEVSIHERPLTKSELWEAPATQVIQALWDGWRPASASREVALRFEPADPPFVPAAGTAVVRRLYSSCSGIQTIRWQLVWSPTEAWVVCGGEEPEMEDRSFLYGVSEPQNPLFARELSAAQGRRLAELVATLCATRASGVEPVPEEDAERVIVMSHARGELVLRSADGSSALYERRADLTPLLIRNSAAWRGDWTADMVPCVVPTLFATALEPFPAYRDRIGASRAARRQAAGWAFSRELAKPGSVHPFHLATAATSAGQEGWIELRTAIADLASRHGEPSEWERRTLARSAEIQRLIDSLGARKEKGLTGAVIESDIPVENIDADGKVELPPSFSDATRDDLKALRKLREERREAEPVTQLGDADEPGRASAVLRRALSTAARRMDAWNDGHTLRAWAAGGSPWAYHRLRAFDPAEADSFLIEELKMAPDPINRRRIVEEIERTASERGRAALAELPPESSMSDAADEQGEVIRLPEELLCRVRDRSLECSDRLASLRKLTGRDDERLRPGGEFDRALAAVLRDEQRSDDSLQSMFLGELAKTLARQGGEHWELIADAATQRGVGDNREIAEIAAGLMSKNRAEPGQFRSSLLALLRSRLTRSSGDRSELIWVAWTTGARELRDVIARQGTFSPEDREGPERNLDDELAAPACSHLARQVASLWDEQIPSARLRLLAAFAFRNAGRFAEAEGPPARQLASEWRRSMASLAPGEATLINEAIRELDAAELAESRHGDDTVNAILRFLSGLCAEGSAADKRARGVTRFPDPTARPRAGDRSWRRDRACP